MAIVSIAAAACGGGGGGGSAVPPASNGAGSNTAPVVLPTVSASSSPANTNVTMSLTVTIPGKKSSARARGPQYIAPNSGSMSLQLLTLNGAAVSSAPVQGPFNLTAGASNPNCTANAGGTTCTFSISAPVGSDIFLATTYASNNGTGTPLGSGAILLSVRQNTQNVANLSLTGPVASVQVLSATSVLWNGNPVPNAGDSVSSITRITNDPQGKQLLAKRKSAALASAATTASATRSAGALPTAGIRSAGTRSAAGTRRPSGQVVSSGAQPTPGPVTTSPVRIFVIALDAAGNQIINPTTFDIPINLQLTLNGLPAGDATLTVSYAGLTGEPSSPASTSTDGGTVTVLAPSDVVTIALPATTTVNQIAPFTPTIVASYTPQGGTVQTTAPLSYNVFVPPPSAVLTANASHIDPFTTNVTAQLTMSVGNVGTLATSGQIQVYVYPDGWSYVDDNGSDPSWTCNYTGYVYCTSNATIAANGSLPLTFDVTPNNAPNESNEIDVFGGSALNGSADVYVVDSINVTNTPTAALSLSVNDNGGNFYTTVNGTYTLTLTNNGTAATVGNISLTDTLPSNFGYVGAVGANWACLGPAPTIVCTYSSILASQANTVLTLTVTPVAANLDSNASNSVSGTGGGASPFGPVTNNTYVSSPVQFVNPGFNIGTQYGNGFYGTPDNASLEIGAPPASPLSGTISIQPQYNYFGQYTLVSDTCNGPVIDSAFDSAFPVTAAGLGVPVSVPLNFFAQMGPAGPCMIMIQDSSGNPASLTLGVNQTQLTIQNYRRSKGRR